MVRAGAIFSIVLGIAAALTVVLPDRPSFASERPIVLAQNDNGGGFFRRLFGGSRRFAPSAPQRSPLQLFPGFEQPPPPPQQQRRERRARAPAQPAPREIAAVAKAEDAKRAMVVGDFMAGALAKGLAEAYSDNPNVVVIDATSGSSGLVRDDFYDWPAKLSGLAEQQKPDVILVMIGGNDRQTLRTDSGAQALGSDSWRAAYAARVAAFADALKATGKPILWGGLVPVQSGAMSRDYSNFNGIVREQLEAKGLPFIDMWIGFADDEGKYVAVGPDIRGQSLQLRASDGLNFTKAGQRKLAYFVEQELNDIFGGTAPQLATAVAPTAPLGAGTPDAPRIGPMVPLDALSAAGGDELASPSAEPGNVAAAVSAGLAKESPETPPAARVDSFVWQEQPASTPTQPTSEAAAATLPTSGGEPAAQSSAPASN